MVARRKIIIDADAINPEFAIGVDFEFKQTQRIEVDSGEIILQSPFTVTTDGLTQSSVDIPCKLTGSINYTVTVIKNLIQILSFSFNLSLGNGSDIYLSSLVLGGQTASDSIKDYIDTEFINSVVRFDVSQSLTSGQQSQARTNIGLGSGGTVRYIHTQSSALATWIVNHNLGEKPLAQIIDAGSNEVEAEIIHISNNQLNIYFSSVQTGQVRCI